MAPRETRDLLAALIVSHAVNPGQQTSDFGLEQVARLVAFLKQP